MSVSTEAQESTPPFDPTIFLTPAESFMAENLQEPGNWSLIDSDSHANKAGGLRVTWSASCNLTYKAAGDFKPQVFHSRVFTRKHLDLTQLMRPGVSTHIHTHDMTPYRRSVEVIPYDVPGLLTKPQVLRGDDLNGRLDWAVIQIRLEPCVLTKNNLFVGENSHRFKARFRLERVEDVLLEEIRSLIGGQAFKISKATPRIQELQQALAEINDELSESADITAAKVEEINQKLAFYRSLAASVNPQREV